MSLSHDSISRCLSTSKVRPQDLWESARKEIGGKCGILGFDIMLSSGKSRGLEPEMVVADSWYSSMKNLKSIRCNEMGLVNGFAK